MEGVGGHLSSYDENSEFRKIALMIIAHKSSTEEIVELRKAFDQFDSQNDGRITYKEFQAALEKMNFTEEDMNRMFQSVVRTLPPNICVSNSK
jgi:Ca2+-binding EF-hand superfamily protein